jgi:Winged helix-turn-helix domain (DUF2582)
MTEEIGAVAGAVWHALDANGEMTLAKLKKEVKTVGPLFDWGIGWLAREDKIELTRDKKSIRVSLKGRQAQSASAA